MTNAVSLAQQASTGVSQGFKNRIINGAMVIDQRNAGAAVTNVSNQYVLDRWSIGSSSDAAVTVQQSTTAPAGFKNSMKLLVATADTSIGAAQYYQIIQPIEGNNVADFSLGNSSAVTFTLSFWVQSSKTGTYCATLGNGNANRLYPVNFTVSSANTWEQKTITVAGDQTGTWTTNNGVGLYVMINLALGSNFNAGTNATWNTSQYGTSSQVNWLDTVNATFYITGVQLEVGSTATSFDYRPYGTELQLCQRYYYKKGPQSSSDVRYGIGFSGSGSSTTAYINITLPVNMRTGPTSVDWSNTLALWAGASNFQVTAISIYSSGSGMTDCLLQCTSSGLTGEKAYQLVAWSSGGGSLALGAEL